MLLVVAVACLTAASIDPETGLRGGTRLRIEIREGSEESLQRAYEELQRRFKGHYAHVCCAILCCATWLVVITSTMQRRYMHHGGSHQEQMQEWDKANRNQTWPDAFEEFNQTSTMQRTLLTYISQSG